MYHPSRGGVRGGRDQFNWDDVKADKHRENYIGHSIKAPVGRWQKGKDLHWYAKGNSKAAADAAREEIARIKEEEEQLMREALGLAPKREKKAQGSNIDKHEAAELFKKGEKDESAPDQAIGERVEGLGFAPAPKPTVVKRDASEEPQLGRTSEKAKANIVNREAHLPQRHGREVVSNTHVEGGRRVMDDHKGKRTRDTEGDQQLSVENPRHEHGLQFVERQGGSCDSGDIREPGAQHPDIHSHADVKIAKDTRNGESRVRDRRHEKDRDDTHNRADIRSPNDTRNGDSRVRDREHERDRDSARHRQEKGFSSHGLSDRRRENRYSDSQPDRDAPTSGRKNKDVADDRKDRRHSKRQKDYSDSENGSHDRH